MLAHFVNLYYLARMIEKAQTSLGKLLDSSDTELGPLTGTPLPTMHSISEVKKLIPDALEMAANHLA